MGSNKIPLTSEKTYSFSGVYDIKHTYSFLKDFLESSRHYDVTEKEYEEKTDGGSKKISSTLEAEQEYNDYYKVIIKFKIEMSGKELSIDDPNISKNLIKGSAKLVLNSYIEVDHMGKRPKGPLGSFLERIYSNYFGKDEFGKVAVYVSKDVSELITRFKQSMNTTV